MFCHFLGHCLLIVSRALPLFSSQSPSRNRSHDPNKRSRNRPQLLTPSRQAHTQTTHTAHTAEKDSGEPVCSDCVFSLLVSLFPHCFLSLFSSQSHAPNKRSRRGSAHLPNRNGRTCSKNLGIPSTPKQLANRDLNKFNEL